MSEPNRLDDVPRTPAQVRDLVAWARTNPRFRAVADGHEIVLHYLLHECGIERSVLRDHLVAVGWTEAVEALDRGTAELKAAGVVL